jgi:uroporphyrinogen decarboxylase
VTDGPNFDAYLDAIYRRNAPEDTPIGELFVEQAIIEQIVGEPYDIFTEEGFRTHIEAHARLGYDAITVGAGLGFAMAEPAITDDVAPISKGKRAYLTAAGTRIWDRASYEAYPWPTPEQADYTMLERAVRLLPDGMGILASAGGPCEWLMWICGYEPLSYMLGDDPELVTEIVARIREQMVAVARQIVTMDRVGAVWISDDMGFKTGTFLSPPQMREHVFVTQREIAKVAHDAGLPCLLHSCGNLAEVMDDLIEDVGIDAKHSYEDVICPVAEAKRLWGDRVAIIGGVDVDVLTRQPEAEVRRYTRKVLEECAPGGGYLLGSGNSVANYIPVGNYLAMLDVWRGFCGA